MCWRNTIAGKSFENIPLWQGVSLLERRQSEYLFARHLHASILDLFFRPAALLFVVVARWSLGKKFEIVRVTIHGFWSVGGDVGNLATALEKRSKDITGKCWILKIQCQKPEKGTFAALSKSWPNTVFFSLTIHWGVAKLCSNCLSTLTRHVAVNCLNERKIT